MQVPAPGQPQCSTELLEQIARASKEIGEKLPEGVENKDKKVRLTKVSNIVVEDWDCGILRINLGASDNPRVHRLSPQRKGGVQL